eukprot:UN04323
MIPRVSISLVHSKKKHVDVRRSCIFKEPSSRNALSTRTFRT